MEPNTDHHEGLRKRIKEAGLSDVYVIVPVGAENLGTRWVQKEEVDSIITFVLHLRLYTGLPTEIHFIPPFETSLLNYRHGH